MTGKRRITGVSSAASAVIALAIVAIVALWFRSGNIKVDCSDTSIKVTAPYWTDMDISYSEIDNATYRKDLDVGVRTVGVGTARLSVGTFHNAEFGSYTLYADADATEFIVLTSNEQTIVIGMSSAEDTETVYETLIEKAGN